ncbi:MAG: radical SAM protein [Methanobrevibacter thaueri]|jgi:DNA repair photolyase|uniref:SPL family radical SAM protein n=1 Tax=Methanobrevibacter thaueri TaxID=190975 RepID=UPI0026E9962F|nr:radical SAM protein [Methanobrevibacter thaueri]MBE6495685.1 radical SAM protein [Methanobrevibacter thaueri]
MHYVKAKGIFTSDYGINLYRGCTHGCIYCDSRSAVYNINHKFEDIEVKENAVELLKKELIKRKPCMIGTGAMTDPYIPLEKRLEYVRKSLKLVYRYGFGWACITKSDLVLRDIDLLKKINEKTKAVVQITLTTADDDLCRMIEPNVCATSRRVEVLQRLKEENIPTVVWLCPLLPHINATEENINALLDFCIDAEVKGVLNMGMGLSLREGNREYFYEQLDKSFPGLKERYIEEYGDSYFIHSRDDRRLRKILRNRCDEHGIMHNQDEIFSYLHEFPEKSVQSKLL